MNKDLLIKLIEDGLSTYEIAKKLNCSQTNVRYWLEKFELNTIISKKHKKHNQQKICPRCQIIKTECQFYKRRSGADFSSYCKECTSKQVLDRQRRVKAEAVAYKGGKCIKCGYSKYLGAMEFHHLNPSEKDFAISQVKATRMNEDIKRELDKCVLLCANCHKETHGEMKCPKPDLNRQPND